MPKTPTPVAVSDLLQSRAVCQILDINASTLSRWVQRGIITPAYKYPGIRGIALFNPADVEALAAERSA